MKTVLLCSFPISKMDLLILLCTIVHHNLNINCDPDIGFSIFELVLVRNQSLN